MNRNLRFSAELELGKRDAERRRVGQLVPATMMTAEALLREMVAALQNLASNSGNCGAGQLPNCKVKGATALLPQPPDECAKWAGNLGKELCVTHAGFVGVNVAPAAIPFSIVPRDATAYWAQLLAVVVFDTGTQTRITNGEFLSIQIRGSSQLAGSPVPLLGFTPEMPFLGVAWDMADATNPITGTVSVRGAVGNVDAHIFTVGYGIR